MDPITAPEPPVTPVSTPNPGLPPEPQDFSKFVPQEFTGKEYLKDVKDVPGLFKKLDGAMALIGKRPAGIPQDNAPVEEWQAFNKSFGVPEKAEEYELAAIPEGLPKNEAFEKSMREVFQKAGLSKRQAKALSEGYNGALQSILKEAGVNAEAQEVDFENLATQTFADRKDKVLLNSKALIAKYAAPAFKDKLGSLDNNSLIIMASVLDGIHREFIKEDALPVGGEHVGPMTDDQRREEGRKLMASEAYTNPFHKDHDAVVKKVAELYQAR